MDLSGKNLKCLNISLKVCDKHFEKKMYVTGKLLLHTAAPTIFAKAKTVEIISSPRITSPKTVITTASNSLCSSKYYLLIFISVKI